MNRRTLLAQIGAVATAGLGGCIAEYEEVVDGGTGGETETETGESQTPENETTGPGNETATEPAEETPTTTPGDEDGTESPSEAGSDQYDASLTVLDSSCGQQRDEASVGFDQDAGEVVVTGTIWGSDLCKTAELVGVQYDEGADELTVTVGTTDRESDGTPACGQCITEIEYRVNAAFDGELPGSVTVVHDHGDGGKTVTTSQS